MKKEKAAFRAAFLCEQIITILIDYNPNGQKGQVTAPQSEPEQTEAPGI